MHSVGGKIWTIDGYNDNPGAETLSIDEDEETRILLEKEFDDYYENRTHKSAGPVVFLSKCLGMLPVIWTDDDAESDCKVTILSDWKVVFTVFCLFRATSTCTRS